MGRKILIVNCEDSPKWDVEATGLGIWQPLIDSKEGDEWRIRSVCSGLIPSIEVRCYCLLRSTTSIIDKRRLFLA